MDHAGLSYLISSLLLQGPYVLWNIRSSWTQSAVQNSMTFFSLTETTGFHLEASALNSMSCDTHKLRLVNILSLCIYKKAPLLFISEFHGAHRGFRLTSVPLWTTIKPPPVCPHFKTRDHTAAQRQSSMSWSSWRLWFLVAKLVFCCFSIQLATRPESRHASTGTRMAVEGRRGRHAPLLAVKPAFRAV